jgi:DNA primase large subunit
MIISKDILDIDRRNIEEQLVSNDQEYSNIRKNAYRLILGSLTEGEDHGLKSPEDLSCLPLALWILRYIDENILTSRTINFVRDFVESYILSNRVSDEDIEIISREFSLAINYETDYDCFSIPVGQFVANVARLSGYNYRLVYQNVDRGIVSCQRSTVAKVIREAFVRNAFKSYNSIKHEDAVETLQPIYEEISNIISTLKASGIKVNVDLGTVDFTLFPPCIKEYISEMREGINLPHMARFTLVSFLHKIGMENDAMVQLFKTAPDFNERMTTYQINHITGQISSTEYSPPKCSVLLSNHLCFKGDDPICNKEWLKHPLQYYTFKKRIGSRPQIQGSKNMEYTKKI